VGIEREADAPKTWIHVNAFPECDLQATLRQVIVTFVDITERKEAMEAVRENEEKFRALFAASRDAILLLDEHSYFDCNQAALEMFRCPNKEDFCSKKVGEISAPRQPGGKPSAVTAKRIVKTALRTGVGCFEWVHQRFDGTQFQAEISLNSLVLQGRPVIQAVVRDISWRKEAEQQLRERRRHHRHPR
jgi:PAS domain S-box-containing protein